MNREKAKKMAQSRDCHCIKGKDRDSNYNECIDKIFDYFETSPNEAMVSLSRNKFANIAEKYLRTELYGIKYPTWYKNELIRLHSILTIDMGYKITKAT